MQLPLTEKYFAEGIKLIKLISTGGFFGDPVYDQRTVFDLEEAVDLHSNKGWQLKESKNVFANLSLNLYRDLKNHKICTYTEE